MKLCTSAKFFIFIFSASHLASTRAVPNPTSTISVPALPAKNIFISPYSNVSNPLLLPNGNILVSARERDGRDSGFFFLNQKGEEISRVIYETPFYSDDPLLLKNGNIAVMSFYGEVLFISSEGKKLASYAPPLPHVMWTSGLVPLSNGSLLLAVRRGQPPNMSTQVIHLSAEAKELSLVNYPAEAYPMEHLADGSVWLSFIAKGRTQLHRLNEDGSSKFNFDFPHERCTPQALTAAGDTFISCRNGSFFAVSPRGNITKSFSIPRWDGSAVRDSEGRFIITDGSSARVYFLDPSLEIVREINVGGSAFGSPSFFNDGGVLFCVVEKPSASERRFVLVSVDKDGKERGRFHRGVNRDSLTPDEGLSPIRSKNKDLVEVLSDGRVLTSSFPDIGGGVVFPTYQNSRLILLNSKLEIEAMSPVFPWQSFHPSGSETLPLILEDKTLVLSSAIFNTSHPGGVYFMALP